MLVPNHISIYISVAHRCDLVGRFVIDAIGILDIIPLLDQIIIGASAVYHGAVLPFHTIRVGVDIIAWGLIIFHI